MNISVKRPKQAFGRIIGRDNPFNSAFCGLLPAMICPQLRRSYSFVADTFYRIFVGIDIVNFVASQIVRFRYLKVRA